MFWRRDATFTRTRANFDRELVSPYSLRVDQPQRSEARALFDLAWPITLTHLGNQLLGVVDSAIVGRYTAAAFGAVTLGNGVLFCIVCVGLGILLGFDPLTSQALGAGEVKTSRAYLWQSYWVVLMVSAGIIATIVITGQVLPHLSVPADVARETVGYLYGRLPGVLAFMTVVASRVYLQAHSVTRPMVIGMIVANIVNVPLDFAFVFGDAGLAKMGLGAVGLHAMGAAGAGLSTSVSNYLQLAIVLYAVSQLRLDEPVPRRLDWTVVRRAVRVGWPIALTMLAEVGMFTLGSFLVASFGTVPLGGHNVAITFASLSFQVPLAIGAATSVRIGLAIGRDDTPAARRSGRAALTMCSIFMGTTGLVFAAFPHQIAALLTNQADVILASRPLLYAAAAFQLFDGWQAVATGALRGAGDTRASFIINLIGYYAICLPIALGLAFVANLQALGVWLALDIGLAVVAVALVARFFRLTSKSISRV